MPSLSQQLSAISVRISSGQSAISCQVTTGVSVRGLQFALNTISARAGAVVVGGSVAPTSQQFSVLSQAVSVLAAAHNTLSNVVSNALSAGEIVSNAVSVLSQANSAAHAALSTRIDGVGAGSVTSVEAQAISAQAASALSQSVSVLSQAISVVSHARSVGDAALSVRIDAIPGAGSVNAIARVSVAQGISATGLTNVSGLSVSVSAGGWYDLHGRILWSTSVANAMKWGLTYPAMTQFGAVLRGTTSILAGAGASTFSSMYAGEIGAGNTGVVAVSIAVGAGAHLLVIEGACLVGTGGVIQLQAATSVATSPLEVKPGSFMRVFRIG